MGFLGEGMKVLDWVQKVLDRIPILRRLRKLPSEVDELKAKVAALEEKLGDTWPPDVCRFCGKRALRLSGTELRNMRTGVWVEEWACAECGNSEERFRKAT